jgi:drug/metabolite transporter (DMT)-like permease
VSARVWTALGIVYVVWGSTYLGIRVVVETMPPLLTSGVRFVAAGAIMWAAMAIRRGLGGVRIDRRQLLACVIVGACLVAGGNGLVMVAEQDVPSGLAALIMAAIPLWVVLLRRATGERVGAATLAGVAVGFVGVALLLLPGGGGAHAPLGPLLVVVCASFLWSVGTILSRRLPLPPDAFVSTSVQMITGGLIAAAAGLVHGEAGDFDVGSFSTRSWVALAYLVFVGAIVAYTAYSWVLQHAPVSTVATYAYVNPVVAVFLGWLILDEQVTLAILVAAAIIVGSVAVIVRRESRAAPTEETPAPTPIRVRA